MAKRLPCLNRCAVFSDLTRLAFLFSCLQSALINSGYDENDTTWELVWLQNRFLHIENAENMSHSIPGNFHNKKQKKFLQSTFSCCRFCILLTTVFVFCYSLGLRQNYDIFPQEIYYCLSEAKVNEYESRWSKNGGLWSRNDDLWSTKDTTADKWKRKMESTEKELNKKLLTMLSRKGDRMHNLEQQLKRIEKMLMTQRAKSETETNESTTDDSESNN